MIKKLSTAKILILFKLIYKFSASLVAQVVKNLPAMRETWFPFLVGEDPLEKKMATYSSSLTWRNPWGEETGGLQSMEWQKSDMT